MKVWVVLLALGIVGLATGGAMVAAGWHHTVGLVGLWGGVILVLAGLVVSRRRRDIKAERARIAGPSQRAGLRKLLLAVFVVVVVGVGAFYGASYLASVQSGGSPSTSSTNSQSTGSSSSVSLSTVSSATTTITSSSTSSSGQITIVTVSFLAGTATNASAQGTAALYIVLQNSGPTTTISSVEVSSLILTPPTAYLCPSSTSCSPISSPVVSADSRTSFATSTTGFYLGAKLAVNQEYLYQITFADGETLSGAARAAP